MTTTTRRDIWRPNRNYVRAGDPVRVTGIRGACRFLAYVERDGYAPYIEGP